jgi:hypothetical protein
MVNRNAVSLIAIHGLHCDFNGLTVEQNPGAVKLWLIGTADCTARTAPLTI